jgi:hypothetical protein
MFFGQKDVENKFDLSPLPIKTNKEEIRVAANVFPVESIYTSD